MMINYSFVLKPFRSTNRKKKEKFLNATPSMNHKNKSKYKNKSKNKSKTKTKRAKHAILIPNTPHFDYFLFHILSELLVLPSSEDTILIRLTIDIVAKNLQISDTTYLLCLNLTCVY